MSSLSNVGSIVLTVIVAVLDVLPGSVKTIVSLTTYAEPTVVTVTVGLPEPSVAIENLAAVPEPELLV